MAEEAELPPAFELRPELTEEGLECDPDPVDVAADPARF